MYALPPLNNTIFAFNGYTHNYNMHMHKYIVVPVLVLFGHRAGNSVIAVILISNHGNV